MQTTHTFKDEPQPAAIGRILGYGLNLKLSFRRAMADNESSYHLRAPACRQRTRMTEDDDAAAKDSRCSSLMSEEIAARSRPPLLDEGARKRWRGSDGDDISQARKDEGLMNRRRVRPILLARHGDTLSNGGGYPSSA
jgi:hypothetical protein